MVAHKHTARVIAALMALACCLCLCIVLFSDRLPVASGDAGVSQEYESALFDTSEIIRIDIQIDEADWQSLLDNASAEEYQACDVTVNGETFYNVAIRPKGNTSLTTIASDPTTDRYSFKLEFDHYVDGQTCFGLDKLILNNNYADATSMKEALIYDMFHFLGADASLYNYAEISVNGEYWGVYLALEAVEDSFLLRNYGAQNGTLYKPDSMNIGGAVSGERDEGSFSPPEMPGGMDFSQFGGEMPGGLDFSQFGGEMPGDFAPPETDSAAPDNAPDDSAGGETQTAGGTDSAGGRQRPGMGGAGFGGGFSMGGGGADLNYIDDDPDSYSTIWEGAVTDTSDAGQARVIQALKNAAQGTELEASMDIDNLLRYMAAHVFSVNEDSLSGMMAHNYYLYESGGQLNIIPWDYNLALGGMGGSDATSVVNDAIDNAFSGTDFFDALLENQTYHEQYYAYLRQLVDEYINGGGFDAFYGRVRSQIDALVEADPTAFYSYEEYLAAVETLYATVTRRGQSISGQLDGTIPSTAQAQSGSDALIDASDLDLSVMGSMNTGGGPRTDAPEGFTAAQAQENTGAPDAAPEGFASAQAQESTGAPDAAPEGFTAAQAQEDAATPDAAAPEGFTAAQAQENTGAPDAAAPEGFTAAQAQENTGAPDAAAPEGFTAAQAQENTGAPDAAPENIDSAQARGDAQRDDRFSPSGDMPAFRADSAAETRRSNLIWYGASLALIAAALLFALRYRRKPPRRR